MALKLTNNALGRLASGIISSDTVLTLSPGHGAKFPSPGVSDIATVTLVKADGSYEICRLISRVDDVLTVERGYEGTLALSFAANDRVESRMTALATMAEFARIEGKIDAALPKAGGIMTGDLAMGAGTKIVFEGTTDDANEVTIDPGDPTADRVLQLPDRSGTLATEAESLQKSGGTMTGPLTLAGNATSALEAVTKQQLDAAIPAIPPSFLTGMGMDWWLAVAPAGWVYASGRTIGNAASGATERANADCEALFTALWNSYSDTILPVSGGRGASAAADWAANKTITLIDKRGRVSVGKDDMGGTNAARLSSTVASTTLGGVGGSQTHTLSIAEMPSHNHPGSTVPLYDWPNISGAYNEGTTVTSGGASTSVNVASQGGGAAHQNTQPSIVCNYIIKL